MGGISGIPQICSFTSDGMSVAYSTYVNLMYGRAWARGAPQAPYSFPHLHIQTREECHVTQEEKKKSIGKAWRPEYGSAKVPFRYSSYLAVEIATRFVEA